MGYLTTHVLDTAGGCPGSDIPVTLYRVTEERQLITQVTTNSDGRCDQPLMEGEAFTAGVYELVFEVANYYRNKGVKLAQPAFLDEIVLRFAIAEESEHYHVPLLVSPYSYSTYRGS